MQKKLLILEAPGLTLGFTQRDDRYGHRLFIEKREADEAPKRDAVCCESVSGTSVEDWPADPPLQQVVLETCGVPPTEVAFGVGMSGAGHWSLAAQAVEHPIPAIQFDWACRIHRAADRLSSTYRLAPRSAFPRSTSLTSPRELTEQRGAWSLEDGRCLLVAVAEGRLRWLSDQTAFVIEPASDIHRAGTHCWRYCLSVV